MVVAEAVKRLGLDGGEHLAAAITPSEGPAGLPLLGQLVWYSVQDSVRLGADVLKGLYEAHGLPAQHAPRPIRNRDAFRRASSGISRRVPTQEGEIRYMVRDVHTGPSDVTRALVAEVVDKEGRRLAYYHVANWVYQDETDSIYLVPGADTVPADIEDTARQLFDGCCRAFDAAKSTYTSSHVRQIIRRVLDDLYPVVVRPSGGVYFVPAGHEPTLRALQAFTAAAGERGGGHTEFRLVPLVDTSEQRDMVRTSVLYEVRTAVEGLLHQMEQIRHDRQGQELRPSDLRAVGERWQYLGDMVARYRRLLEDQLAEIEGFLEVGRRKVEAFLASAAGGA